MSIQRCRTGWIRWMDPMALKLDRPPAIPFRLRAGCDASNIRRLLHRHPESRNQTVHFPESDCADSGIRLCIFRNQTVRIPESDCAFPKSDLVFLELDCADSGITGPRRLIRAENGGPLAGRTLRRRPSVTRAAL